MSQKFGTLKKRLVSAVFFSAGGQIGRHAVQLLTVALLARMLGPGPLGVMALAAVIMAFAHLLVDLGLGQSVIREKEISQTQQMTVFGLNLAAALVLYPVFDAAAPSLGSLLGIEALGWVLPVVAPGFLLVAVMQSRRAMLARAFRFRAVAAIELSSIVVGSGTSLFLTWRGWGLSGLAYGSLVQNLAWSAGVVLAAGLPKRAPFSPKSVVPLLRFGGHMTGFGVVNYVARRTDKLIVGGFMGAVALGLYEKAYALMMLPVTHLTGSIGQVMYPALSKVRDKPERFSFLYLGAVRKIAGLSFPAAAFCIVAADEIVLLVLGDRFAGAGEIFAVLSLIMAFQPIVGTFGWLYMTTGKTGRMFAWGAFGALVVSIAFFLGARRGSPVDVARAYAYASIALLPFSTLIACRTAGIPLRAFLGRILYPCLAAASAWAVGAALPSLGLPATFFVVGGVYGAVYGLLDSRAFFDLIRFLNPARAFET